MRKCLFLILLLIPFSAIADDLYLCTRVVDGDTIIVIIDGREDGVRLIGVDTPETVHPEKPAEIVKQGFGFAYTKYPFKYMDDFRQYEKEARDLNKGLWGNK